MNPNLVLAVRWLLGGVFIYAGVSKALDVQAFSVAIGRYRLLPEFGNLLVACVLPYLEIYTALLLLAGRWLRAAAWLSMAMSSVFCVALLSAAGRGLAIDCGCFASATSVWTSLEVALLRAIALLGFSIFLWLAVAPPLPRKAV